MKRDQGNEKARENADETLRAIIAQKFCPPIVQERIGRVLAKALKRQGLIQPLRRVSPDS